jgi:hypothetical protein
MYVVLAVDLTYPPVPSSTRSRLSAAGKVPHPSRIFDQSCCLWYPLILSFGSTDFSATDMRVLEDSEIFYFVFDRTLALNGSGDPVSDC